MSIDACFLHGPIRLKAPKTNQIVMKIPINLVKVAVVPDIRQHVCGPWIADAQERAAIYFFMWIFISSRAKPLMSCPMGAVVGG
jgi:hypothetical protein